MSSNHFSILFNLSSAKRDIGILNFKGRKEILNTLSSELNIYSFINESKLKYGENCLNLFDLDLQDINFIINELSFSNYILKRIKYRKTTFYMNIICYTIVLFSCIIMGDLLFLFFYTILYSLLIWLCLS